MRVALISSPRSGNTWLRYLLRSACGLTELAENNPWDVDWGSLPDRCVLQMHCHRDHEVLDQLAAHGFRLVHLLRHPLDLLVSILQCCATAADTHLWVAGEGGDESTIKGRGPQDPEFLEYATGPRARVLLSISLQWWTAGGPGARLRYEDLVADPVGVLARTLDEIGVEPVAPLETVVEANRIDRLRPLAPTFFWRGEPGLWRRVVPAPLADEIYASHRHVFRVGGHPCDPDPNLTRERAAATWQELAG